MSKLSTRDQETRKHMYGSPGAKKATEGLHDMTNKCPETSDALANLLPVQHTPSRVKRVMEMGEC